MTNIKIEHQPPEAVDVVRLIKKVERYYNLKGEFIFEKEVKDFQLNL